MTALRRIGLTMGDPAGVGPELCLRLLAHPEMRALADFVVFGDAVVLGAVAHRLQLPRATAAAVRDLGQVTLADFTPGQVSAAAGRAAYAYVEAGIRAALAGEVDAICTAPLHKEALSAAGIAYPGHTEILAALTGTERYCMMLTAPEITCSLVTCHVGYHEVPGLLGSERIVEVIELTAQAMQVLRGRPPRLVVCGLNPHAGEHGLFGNGEEERFIVPAIATARERGHAVEGPIPPDTAFVRQRRDRTDAYICMYHDQGLIPLKALAFDEGVNVTLGLPIVRTSVDHGTAFDIAWQGIASPSSFLAAARLAVQLAGCRDASPRALVSPQ